MTQQFDDILSRLGEARQHLTQGMTDTAAQTLEKALSQLALLHGQLSAAAGPKVGTESAIALAGARSSLWQRVMDSKAEMEQSLRGMAGPSLAGDVAPQSRPGDDKAVSELLLAGARAEIKGTPSSRAEVEAKSSALIAEMKERHAAECRAMGAQLASAMAEIQRLTGDSASLERRMTEQMEVLEQRLQKAKAALERRLALDRADEASPAETSPQIETKEHGAWATLWSILRRRW